MLFPFDMGGEKNNVEAVTLPILLNLSFKSTNSGTSFSGSLPSPEQKILATIAEIP